MSGVVNLQRVPARGGLAARVNRGQHVKIINTHGKQVVDTWAFNCTEPDEYLSMEHSRVSIGKLVPRAGDTLVSNGRRPMLTLVEDTTPGDHDTLIAACDQRRYELLGVVGHHDNCSDNLHAALGVVGMRVRATPCPLNLFMNVGWRADGSLHFLRPTSEAGQWVSLRAEMDLYLVLSCCPQDLIPVNDMRSTEVHFSID